MKKLIIEMTDEQYKQIEKENMKSFVENLKEETNGENKFILSIGGGLAYLDYEGNKKIDLEELTSALLKYCELDTLAMVMVYEHFKELIG